MSSDTNLIAERYVTAFFDLATDQRQHDNVKKDLLMLKEVLAKSAELQKLLVNPVITRKQSAEAIRAVLSAVGACDLTKKFFTLLANQRRLAATSVMIEKYLDMLAKSRGELVVQVTSASNLSKEQLATLSSALTKATKKKIELKLTQNPELIGGVQVRIGSQMLDNSISGKLSRLRIALAKAA